MNMGQAVLPQTTIQPDLSNAGPFQPKEDFGFGRRQNGFRLSAMIIIVVLSFILIILNAIQIIQLNNMNNANKATIEPVQQV